jgi:nickel-dependent lactate racemase
MCGFGGGAKIAFPGVANYEAIRDHHCALMIAKGSSLGVTENNPFYEEVCQAGRLAKLDFLLNVVYKSNEEVKEVVAGDFVKAHTEGVNISLSESAVPFDEPADVTIASAFPHTEGPQITKSLHAAIRVTRQRGIVILYAKTIRGGFPEAFLKAFDTAFALAQGNTKELVLDSCKGGKPIIPTAPMDFNAALNLTLLNLSNVGKIILVTKDVDAQQAARLGFDYSDDLEKALEMVSREVPKATVNILPAGGFVIPLVQSGT